MKIHHFSSAHYLRDAFFEALKSELFSPATTDYGIMISGGSTPLPVYAQLAALGKHCNARCQIIFSDDRHVPRNSPDSNQGNASAMFTALGIAPDRIYGIDPELDLAAAASSLDRRLHKLMGKGVPLSTGFLGLGADGHTCSLFSIAAAGRDDVLAFPVENQLGVDRVSVSRRVLAHVGRLVILVSGEAKSEALEALKNQPLSIPAGVAFAGHPNVEVWSDLPYEGFSPHSSPIRP